MPGVTKVRESGTVGSGRMETGNWKRIGSITIFIVAVSAKIGNETHPFENSCTLGRGKKTRTRIDFSHERCKTPNYICQHQKSFKYSEGDSITVN